MLLTIGVLIWEESWSYSEYVLHFCIFKYRRSQNFYLRNLKYEKVNTRISQRRMKVNFKSQITKPISSLVFKKFEIYVYT